MKKVVSVIQRWKHFLDLGKASRKYWANVKTNNDPAFARRIAVEVSEYNPLETEVILHMVGCVVNDDSKVQVIFGNIRRGSWKYILVYLYQDGFRFSITSVRILFEYLNILSFIEAIAMFKKFESLDSLSKLKYRDMRIGDLVYDSYVRLYAKGFVPEKNIRVLLLLLKSVVLYKAYTVHFKNTKFDLVVSADECYLNHGIFLRLARAKGIKSVYFNGRNLKIFDEDAEYYHKHHPRLDIQELKSIHARVDINEVIKHYFEKRFDGEIDEIDVLTAFKDKHTYRRNQIIEICNLDVNKKIALIMPHAIRDFPHVSKGLYPDYYVWLCNLLVIIKEIRDVNWVIKPHPTSYLFGEVGVTERLINQLGVDNVAVLPKDMSGAAIPKFADVILTVSGTAGLEFATFGIPVINAGTSMYSGYGFSIEPASVFEYISTLKGVSHAEKLNTQQIDTAKYVFYHIAIANQVYPNYLFRGYCEGDSLDSLVPNAINRYNNLSSNEILDRWKKMLGV